MTPTPDLDRRVRQLLQDGPTELPDRAFDDVRRRIEQTRQRAGFGSWRTLPMPNLFKLGVALAAGLSAVAVGIALLGAPPGPTVGQSARPTDTATAQPDPTYAWPMEVTAGTYTTSLIWDVPFAFTFTVPAGWTGLDTELRKDRPGTDPDDRRGITALFSRVSTTFADPCAGTLDEPPVEQTAEAVARALAAIPGVDATDPVASTFAGLPALYLELDMPDQAPCSAEMFRLWLADRDWMRPSAHTGGPAFAAERDRYRIWVVTVADIPFAIAGLSSADASPEELAELQQVLDSVRIVPPVEPTSIGACSLTATAPSLGGREISAPYRLDLVNTTFPVRGTYPVDASDQPLTPGPPLAQLDFSGSGWAPTGAGPGRPGVMVVPPAGSAAAGFATLQVSDGFAGSAVFDDAGRWWVRIVGPAAGCVRQFAVDVG